MITSVVRVCEGIVAKTKEQALSELRARGETVVGWARKNGFDPRLVRGVIYGNIKGKWGVSHKIAVLLGMKDGEIMKEADDENA